MTLISCSSDCIYQENGYCNLNQAAAVGVPSESGCIHYIPKQKPKYKIPVKKNDQAHGDITNLHRID